MCDRIDYVIRLTISLYRPTNTIGYTWEDRTLLILNTHKYSTGYSNTVGLEEVHSFSHFLLGNLLVTISGGATVGNSCTILIIILKILFVIPLTIYLNYNKYLLLSKF